MARFRIVQNRKKCIGCGFCVALCHTNWYMEKDGMASPKKRIVRAIGCNKLAADNCPVQIISVIRMLK